MIIAFLSGESLILKLVMHNVCEEMKLENPEYVVLQRALWTGLQSSGSTRTHVSFMRPFFQQIPFSSSRTSRTSISGITVLYVSRCTSPESVPIKV